MDKRKQSSRSSLLRWLIPCLFWLAVWTAAACVISSELLLPTPLSVIERLGELVRQKLFWQSTGLSLLRIFCGAAGGLAIGCGLAVLTCSCEAADLILSPAIRIIRATPVASFIILVLLWVKSAVAPGVIAGLMVMPVLWENVSAGIRSTDGQLLEMSRSYRLGALKTVRYVYFPAVRKYLEAGICTAVGLAWKSGIAAEVICLPKAAAGTQVYYSKIYLDSPALFAWTAVVLLLSLSFEKLVRTILAKGRGRE